MSIHERKTPQWRVSKSIKAKALVAAAMLCVAGGSAIGQTQQGPQRLFPREAVTLDRSPGGIVSPSTGVAPGQPGSGSAIRDQRLNQPLRVTPLPEAATSARVSPLTPTPVFPPVEARLPAAAEALASGSVEASPNYILASNDRISIRVYNEPDFDATPRIGKDGTVSIPYIGAVVLGGRTVDGATRYVRQILAEDYLVNPQVVVDVLEYSRRRFTILGEVHSPGTYELNDGSPMTIIQAIARAGGFRPGAKQRRVVVTRTVGDQRVVDIVDVAGMVRNPRAEPYYIQPDDHINVDPTFF